MLLLVLVERVEEHLRDVRHPARQDRARGRSRRRFGFVADRVQLSGFGRTPAEIDEAGALARGIAVKSLRNENPDQILGGA